MHDLFALDQRKSAAKWRSAVYTLGLGMAGAGIVLMLLTAWKSFGAAEFEGQVLGVLLLSAGALAVLGSSQRNKNVLTASLLLSLLGTLLAFEFVVEVNRETKTDCALAELYTKSTAVEQMLQEQKKADVFTKLYIRMNEMDEMLSGAQEGAVKALQLKESQQQLRSNDRLYVQGKMRSIKQHAEQLLDDILTHPNMTAPQVNTMTDMQKRELREKVKAADDVIDGVLQKYEEGHAGEVVYEDYEKALHGLLEAYRAPWSHEALQMPFQDTTALIQATDELQHLKSALLRTTANSYHILDPAGHAKELKAMDEKRAQKQQEFSNQFLSMLHRHEMVKHTDFLKDLPQHCLVENQTEGLMITVGLAIMLLEMTAMYCTLSFVLNLASKRLD